jgi:uncharacterized LabA/DUF88 family protein
MIFIDGGYLRRGIRQIFKNEKMDENIDFDKLRDYLMRVVASQGIKPELIRAYYYDAQVDVREDSVKHKKQEAFFKKVRLRKSYELRLGRLIKTDHEDRQKGVDILIAVDMLSKGYLKHYNIAAFLGGDDDFLDLIAAVKNLAGRRVFGFYFSHNISGRLKDCFDVESELTKERAQEFVNPLKSTPTKSK